MLDKQQTIQKLDELKVLYDKLDDCFNKISEVFGSSYFEGSLHEVYCGLFGAYTDLIGECSGIPQETLCWWIFDAGWGEGTNGVVQDGEVTHLTTNE